MCSSDLIIQKFVDDIVEISFNKELFDNVDYRYIDEKEISPELKPFIAAAYGIGYKCGILNAQKALAGKLFDLKEGLKQYEKDTNISIES